MLELTIAPTVSEIVSASVTPPIVIASASRVPSISASPDISKEPASSSPVNVIFLKPVTSLLESAITANEAETVPAVMPSSKLISAAVEVTVVPLIESASVSKVPSKSPSTASMLPTNVVAVTFLNDPISLLESTTTALEAATVPAVTPSIVSNSASDIFAEPITKLVPVIAVPVIAAALLPPIIAPSTVPPLISAVSATKASVVTVPSKNASLNSNELVPRSMSSSTEGTIEPLLNVNWASPPAVIVITSEPLNVILVLVSPSPAIESSCTAPTFDNAASPKSTAPATVRVPDTSTLPFISTVVADCCIS